MVKFLAITKIGIESCYSVHKSLTCNHRSRLASLTINIEMSIKKKKTVNAAWIPADNMSDSKFLFKIFDKDINTEKYSYFG